MYLLEKWPGLTNGMWRSSLRTSTPASCAAPAPAAIPSVPCSMCPRAGWKSISREWASEYQLCDDLRQAVEFTRVNLSEPADTINYRNFDVIFCRNLLIYFDDVSRKTAATHSTKPSIPAVISAWVIPNP